MKVTQEAERLNQRVILLVSAGVIIATLLGVLFAWLLLDFEVGTMPAVERLSERQPRPPAEVNQIETTQFRHATARRPTAAAARHRLGSYGWSDRERQLVRIPVDRAIELRLAGQLPAPDGGQAQAGRAPTGQAGARPGPAPAAGPPGSDRQQPPRPEVP
jgi:hypothetical protein